MAFSVNTPIGDGVTKQFAVNFTNGLFSRDSVHVFVEGEVDGLGEPVERTFTWINDGLIELDGPAPAYGAAIEIRRVMDKTGPAVDFRDGEILTEGNLDRSLAQLLNILHELLDGYFPGGVAGREFAEFLQGVTVRGKLEVEGDAVLNTSDPSNPRAAVNFEQADSRYVNSSGDTLSGNLSIPSATSPEHALNLGQANLRFVNVSGDTMSGPLTLPPGTAANHAAVMAQVENEAAIREDADTHLQNQISGTVPLEASAFSPISWHDPIIQTSVVIPENKNAWSFGPSITIAGGQSVTVEAGSTWTIANGELL